jgi:hypothetical protein
MQSLTSTLKNRMMVSFPVHPSATSPADKYPNFVELEPRKPRDDEVDMFIDLDATREDHEEVRSSILHDTFHSCVNFAIFS